MSTCTCSVKATWITASEWRSRQKTKLIGCQDTSTISEINGIIGFRRVLSTILWVARVEMSRRDRFCVVSVCS
jgi:hypothetical protein